MKVYIDYMVIKSKQKGSHINYLKKTFEMLREYKLELKASKCAFGIRSEIFLGSLVIRRGIKANPDQISTLLVVQSPKMTKHVQKLTGMVAALNRFISRYLDKCRPFFQLLKKSLMFEWTLK